jgi:hypothetical protein
VNKEAEEEAGRKRNEDQKNKEKRTKKKGEE